MLLCTFFLSEAYFCNSGITWLPNTTVKQLNLHAQDEQCGNVNTRCYECVSVCESIYIVTVLYVIPSCGLLDCRGCSSRQGQRGYEHFLLTSLMQHQTLVLYILARTPFLHHTPLTTTKKRPSVCRASLHIVAHYSETQKMPPFWLPLLSYTYLCV